MRNHSQLVTRDDYHPGQNDCRPDQTLCAFTSGNLAANKNHSWARILGIIVVFLQSGMLRRALPMKIAVTKCLHEAPTRTFHKNCRI